MLNVYMFLAVLFMTVHIIDNRINLNVSQGLQRLFFGFITLFLILFAGLRANMGIDYYLYKHIYEAMQNFIDRTDYINAIALAYISTISAEPVYLMLNEIMPSFELVLLFMACIGVGIKCYCIYEHSYYRFFCIFVYFCEVYISYDMGTIRQGVAMSFMLLAFFSLYQKKIKWYCVYAILAFLFHSMAVTLIPLYFIAKKKISMQSMCFWLLLVSPFVFVDINNIFATLVGSIDGVIANRAKYFEHNSGVIFSSLLKYCALWFMFIYAYYKMKIKDDDYVYYCKIFWFGFMLMLMSSSAPFFAFRITKAYYFIQIFLLDRILVKAPKNGIERKFIYIFIALIYLRHLYNILPGSEGNGWQTYLPYENVLFNF